MTDEHLPQAGNESYEQAKAYQELTSGLKEQEPNDLSQAVDRIVSELEVPPAVDTNNMDHDELSEYWERSIQRRLQLSRQLHEEGAPAASLILERIRKGEMRGGTGIEYVNLCATPDNGVELAEFLLEHRFMAQDLQTALERVGGHEILPYLEKYAEPVPRRDSDLDRSGRLNEAIDVALAVEQRLTEPKQREQWQASITKWAEVSNTLGNSQWLDEDALDERRAEQHPDLVAWRHTLNFYRVGNDADFGPSAHAPNAEALPLDPQISREQVVENLFALGEETLELPGAGAEKRKRVLEIMAYHEQNPSPYAITLGLEIEIEKASFVTNLGDAAREQSPDRAEAAYRRAGNYRRTERAGMPAGRDAEWEFAHLPARNYTTLSREVQALIQADLINNSFERHPVHMTLGHISMLGPAGPEVFALARGLEATGWCSSAERIEQPMRTRIDNWLYKGKGGVKERAAGEVKLGAGTAVELRIMELKSLSGADRTMRSAYALGAALRAYQELVNKPDQAADSNKQKLSDIWQDYSTEFNALCAQYDLTPPSQGGWAADTIRDGAGSVLDHRLGPDFLKLADFMREAHRPDSRGGQFQAAAQAAVLRARGRAMEILDRTKPAAG